jgi:hypothetical protein
MLGRECSTEGPEKMALVGVQVISSNSEQEKNERIKW